MGVNSANRNSPKHILPGKRPADAYEGADWANTVYDAAYRNPQNGAILYLPDGWKESNDSELPIARHLVDAGFSVVLRIKHEELPTSDAFVLENGDWRSWEFKSVITSENLETSAKEHFRIGRKQAPTVMVYFQKDVAALGGMERLNRGLESVLRFDKDRLLLQRAAVMASDGRFQILARRELDDGKRFTDF